MNPYKELLGENAISVSTEATSDKLGLPLVFRKRKPGLTRFLISLEIGKSYPLGDFKQSGVYSTAHNLGFKVETQKAVDGLVYIRRVE